MFPPETYTVSIHSWPYGIQPVICRVGGHHRAGQLEHGRGSYRRGGRRGGESRGGGIRGYGFSFHCTYSFLFPFKNDVAIF